ncbi:GGDEF domain-containing protein [Gemmatimonas sp.]
MALDLATLALVVVLVNGIAGSAVMYAGRREGTANGLWLWGAALLVNGLQPLAFGFRFAGPQVPSIALSNALAALVLVLQWKAVARVRLDIVRAPGRLGTVLIPLSAGTAAVLLVRVEYVRNAFGSAVFCALAMAVLVATLRATSTDGHRTRGQQLVAIGTLLLIGVFLWRLFALLSALVGVATEAEVNAIHAGTYFGTLGTMLLQTLGIVLWHKELAVNQQHDLATHDALTGCLNRRALLEECARLLRAETRRARLFAILLFDLDYFKAVNDVYGHLAGDAVLREVANRLCAQLREGDRLARFGGEEFVMLVDDTSEAGALALADRLRASVADAPVVYDGRSIAITVSIGVYVASGHDPLPTIDDMLSASDRALYVAKARGRNCVELASP